MMRTLSHTVALIAAVLGAACARGETQNDAAPVSDSSSVTAATSDLARIPWQPFADTMGGRPFDYGVGVIAIGAGIDTTTRTYPVTDSLVFRAAPRSDAAIVAALLVERSEMGAWAYAMLAPAGTRPNLLEYAYEIAGVPIDSIDASNRWVRGLVGLDASNTMLNGWADLSTYGSERLMWAEHVPQQRLNVLDSARTLLFATRADAEADRNGIPVPARPYTMHALEVVGPWLRVRVQWPFEECSDPDSTKRSDREFWIRYLQTTGRPRVFYASRGC
jgi:hypothetical protein